MMKLKNKTKSTEHTLTLRGESNCLVEYFRQNIHMYITFFWTK